MGGWLSGYSTSFTPRYIGGSSPSSPTNLGEEMSTFVIEYTSCEGNFRWMTIEAKNEIEAESLALEWTDIGGDGIAEVLRVYEGDFLDRN